MTKLQPFFFIEMFTGSLHLTEIRLITKQELKDKSGIYGFIPKPTSKLYIGSSVQLPTRFNNHIKGTRLNIKLQNAINKYKLENLIFFEYCDPEELLSREQFYLDTLQPELNILKTAGSLLGYKHSEESLAKFSGENNPMYGETGENHHN